MKPVSTSAISLIRRVRRGSRTALHRFEAERLGHLQMAEHSYGWPTVHVYPGPAGRIRVGNFTSIAADVDFFTGGEHNPDWVSTFPFRIRFGLPGAYEDGQPSTRGDVEIGNDVWIGRGATILSGVSVGHGAIVAADATVAKDVRPYAVVAGNPGKEIGRRFSDEQVEELLEVAWWDWPLDDVLAAVPLLSAGDVDAFLAAHRSRREVPSRA